ncbi:GLPGLI family protein [Chitinophaga rhizosphaerae]|uniref:GLPGLI family protein n=1 Tax=Chitinophaga rhizosphaerae TaxID=1864947 RepID=UPI000F80DEA2|nr:GLPGLI family protein [Chitinophaga rhizosphaerae]
MKPTFLLLIFILTGGKSLLAQSKHTLTGQAIVGKLHYKFHYMPDTTRRDHILLEDMELAFGKSESSFTSYSKKIRDSITQKNIQKQLAANPATPYNEVQTLLNSFSQTTHDVTYTTISKQQIVYVGQQIANSHYLIPDTAKAIEWTILDSTKSIQGNICQKAMGESHGRMYTAWFCSDIPYSFGPRKLNGLPGLILEAYDHNREVVYTFNNLDYTVTNEKIEIPKNATRITYKEYNKLYNAFKKNPATFWNNSADNGKIKFVTGVSVNTGTQGARANNVNNTNNNPIDLK